MNQLGFFAGRLKQVNDGAIGSVTHACDSSLTSAFCIALENPFYLLSSELATIVNCIDRLGKGFATLWTFESLITLAGAVVLVGFWMVTIGTLHGCLPDSPGFYDASHV